MGRYVKRKKKKIHRLRTVSTVLPVFSISWFLLLCNSVIIGTTQDITYFSMISTYFTKVLITTYENKKVDTKPIGYEVSLGETK